MFATTGFVQKNTHVTQQIDLHFKDLTSIDLEGKIICDCQIFSLGVFYEYYQRRDFIKLVKC